MVLSHMSMATILVIGHGPFLYIFSVTPSIQTSTRNLALIGKVVSEYGNINAYIVLGMGKQHPAIF